MFFSLSLSRLVSPPYVDISAGENGEFVKIPKSSQAERGILLQRSSLQLIQNTNEPNPSFYESQNLAR